MVNHYWICGQNTEKPKVKVSSFLNATSVTFYFQKLVSNRSETVPHVFFSIFSPYFPVCMKIFL